MDVPWMSILQNEWSLAWGHCLSYITEDFVSVILMASTMLMCNCQPLHVERSNRAKWKLTRHVSSPGCVFMWYV